MKCTARKNMRELWGRWRKNGGQRDPIGTDTMSGRNMWSCRSGETAAPMGYRPPCGWQRALWSWRQSMTSRRTGPWRSVWPGASPAASCHRSIFGTPSQTACHKRRGTVEYMVIESGGCYGICGWDGRCGTAAAPFSRDGKAVYRLARRLNREQVPLEAFRKQFLSAQKAGGLVRQET